MKRLTAFLLLLLLFLTGCAADEPPVVYPTAGHLVASWEGEYPHDLCGVWSTDGKWEHITFGITQDEAGEAVKARLLTQIEDHSTVTFAYQEYTYGELFAVMDELGYKMGLRTGMTMLALNDKDNRIIVGVIMKPISPATQTLMEECTAKYGNMVRFEHCNPITLFEDYFNNKDTHIHYSHIALPKSDTPALPVFPMLIGMAVLLLAAALVLYRHRTPLPAEGPPFPLSLGQTEQYVREHTDSPSLRTDGVIQELSARK